MQNKTKVLCVCRWGNIRSVAMARILKKQKFDALACGLNAVNPETLEMLCKWADKVLVAKEEMLQWLPEEHKNKYIDLGIGEDIWLDADHPELMKLTERKLYAVKALLKSH